MLGVLAVLLLPALWYPPPPPVKLVPPTARADPPRQALPLPVGWPPLWYPAQAAAPNAGWNIPIQVFVPWHPERTAWLWPPPTWAAAHAPPLVQGGVGPPPTQPALLPSALAWPSPAWAAQRGATTAVRAALLGTISGVTRDCTTNAPLGGCIVHLFRTSDDATIGTVTSDAAGAYSFSVVIDATLYYLVAYKAGSPDVAGTTVNTIVAT